MYPSLPATGLPVAVVALLCGCGDELLGGDPTPSLPWTAVTLSAVPIPEDNPMTPAKIELGRLLFHDPVLSADGEVACVTCHSQYWGMSDGLPLSVGVDGEGPSGLGRSGPNQSRRNAPTLWNVGHREHLFWDGRADSLESQILGPLLEPGELGKAPAQVVEDLRQIDTYVERFEAAFPDRAEPLSEETFRMAIAAFERTLVSDNAPYDQYVRGDLGAMLEDEVEGMFLFAELGCATCHVPPRYESERFASSGVADGDSMVDRGRFEATGDQRDIGLFRVPTLRNLRETGPYFHNGAVESLEQAIAHEVEAHGTRVLDDGELSDLVAFLRTSLMDKSREPPRPETVPSGLPVPIDGFRVPR